MYCSKCGHHLSQEANFCPYCGTQRFLENGVTSLVEQQDHMSIRNLLFSKNGRLNRVNYIKINLIVSVVSFFLYTVFGSLPGSRSEVTTISGFFLFVLLLIDVVIDYFINVKRLHDIGHGEWLAMLSAFIQAFYVINPRFDLTRWMSLISALGWIWIFIFLYLLLRKGKNGRSEYGDDSAKYL